MSKEEEDDDDKGIGFGSFMNLGFHMVLEKALGYFYKQFESFMSLES